MKTNYIQCGDCLELMKNIPANSIDAIVTDPPYEINFMGKGWDNAGVSFNKKTWKRCYEVLKEGGYLLAFGGSRTFHRIACAIEDAGFEIRDCIMWLYGSGFPKSMNLGLAIDKKNGVESIDTGVVSPNARPNCTKDNTLFESGTVGKKFNIKKATNKWEGWGTCLKPAYEPIIVARKPFKGSLVDNVIKNGVGGLNIDECRVGNEERTYKGMSANKPEGAGCFRDDNWQPKDIEVTVQGRFPANVILTYDETDFDEVCGGFPTEKGNSASRYFYCAKASKKDRDEGLDEFEEKTSGELKERVEGSAGISPYAGSRVPKKNIHPTVKPTTLMQYLVRLVTPKGGTVLDPFMGSGSTIKALLYENKERNANYNFIGFELNKEYFQIAYGRIKATIEALSNKKLEKEN